VCGHGRAPIIASRQCRAQRWPHTCAAARRRARRRRRRRAGAGGAAAACIHASISFWLYHNKNLKLQQN
jgi:hypothetical protein